MVRHAKPHKKKSSLWCIQIGLAIILIILIIATLQQWYQRTQPHTPQPSHTRSSGVTQPAQYDFYALLPNMRVTHRFVDTSTSEQTLPLSQVNAPSPIKRYYLQIGAFRDNAQAHNLINLLDKQGLRAIIKPKTNLQTTFYRVILGPYTQAKSMYIQSMLKKQFYKPLVLKDTSA